MELVKLQDGSVVFEDTSQELVRGQVLKTVERSPRHNPKEPLPGRIRYRGKDRSEVRLDSGMVGLGVTQLRTWKTFAMFNYTKSLSGQKLSLISGASH